MTATDEYVRLFSLPTVGRRSIVLHAVWRGRKHEGLPWPESQCLLSTEDMVFQVLSDRLLKPEMVTMPSLPWSRINDFLLQVCTARNLNDFNALICAHIADLIPHDFPVLTIDLKHIRKDVRYEKEHPDKLLDPGIMAMAGEPSTVADFNQYFRFHMPLTTGYFIDKIIADFRPFANTEFVTDFVRPRNVEQCMGGWFRSCTIVIPRCRHARLFTDKEIAIGTVIAPHLENFYDVLYMANWETEAQLRSVREEASRSGLTEREQEIALLLSERLSMAEIADRLFISPRTVEKHVENIYGKLGIRKKQEVGKRLIGFQPYSRTALS